MREERKGHSRRELSERLDVGRPKMFGGFSSEHFSIDGQRLRAAPERCSSICSICCQSMVGIPGGLVHERVLSIKRPLV